MATANPDPVIFAAVGDVHGSHREMVRQVQELAGELDVRPELVLQVGDFEPHRHLDDVESMAAPSRHRSLGDFPDFVAGRERYPWPVVFIGGNHEPYGFLDGRHDPCGTR